MTDTEQRPSNSFTANRVLKAPAERVYRAFIDPAAMVKWSVPHGFTATIDHIDAVEGGEYRMSFINFVTQEVHSFNGTFVELSPGRRIRTTSVFDNPELSGQMTMTVDLEETVAGTRLTLTQEGLPDQVPVEFAVLGWQESLELLKLLVEPNMPPMDQGAGSENR